MRPVISPSMMCAKADETVSALQQFAAYNDRLMQEEGAEANGTIGFLHMDIMDGMFVPNFALDPAYCRQVRDLCSVPQDVHLMVSAPEMHISLLPDGLEGGMISVHAETVNETGMRRCAGMIRAKGMRVFAALNPETPKETILPYLDILDGVLIMAVHPGFAGQKMVPGTLEKIAACRQWLDSLNHRDVIIEVDGNVSRENAEKMRSAGADIFVAGTASVFREGMVSQERLDILRKAVSR